MSDRRNCDRVCIETDRVFDACLIQSEEQVTVRILSMTPMNPGMPLTFIDGKSTVSGGRVTDSVITPILGGGRRARLRHNVFFPLEFTYCDANGMTGTGIGDAIFHHDLIMCAPEASVMQSEVRVDGSIKVLSAEFVAPDTFIAQCCVTLICKIIVRSEICVPFLGYCQIPRAVCFEENCDRLFGLPLFPR